MKVIPMFPSRFGSWLILSPITSTFLVQSFFETVHYVMSGENSHLSYIRYHRVNFPGGVYDLSLW
jgi:hypothetical protein